VRRHSDSYGPFADSDDARDRAKEHLEDDDWHIAPLLAAEKEMMM